jgi:hypothetical protein
MMMLRPHRVLRGRPLLLVMLVVLLLLLLRVVALVEHDGP